MLAFFDLLDVELTFRQKEHQVSKQEEDQTHRLEAENQTIRQERDLTVRETNPDLSVFQSPVGLSGRYRQSILCQGTYLLSSTVQSRTHGSVFNKKLMCL